MHSSIIFTCREESWELCLDEIKRIPGCVFDKWLMPGVGIIKLPGEFREAASAVRSTRPVFLRHIFPLQTLVSIEDELSHGSWQETLASERLVGAVLELFESVESVAVFSVQVRILDTENYRFNKYDITQLLSAKIQANGGILSVNEPEYVLSLVIHRGTAYIGLSKVSDNLSAWPGGMRRYAKYDEQISRAEFKLLEALEVFDCALPERGCALDLGAAPGGWSKVLLDAGMNVVAVDPGKLDESLTSVNPGNTRPKLIHFQGLSQEYLSYILSEPGSPEYQAGLRKLLQPGRSTVNKRASDYHSVRFDLLVNDMRLDVPDSARIMLDAAELLPSGGLMIMTFKLSGNRSRIIKQIASGLTMLESKFRITDAKQLFHNRSEITVTGKRK